MVQMLWGYETRSLIPGKRNARKNMKSLPFHFYGIEAHRLFSVFFLCNEESFQTIHYNPRSMELNPDAGMVKLRDQDIILNIIVTLHVKLILRFWYVSKSWCKLLKEPHFVKRHLNHAIEMNRFSVMVLSFSVPFCHDESTDAYTLAYNPSLSTLSNPVHINYPLKNSSLGITVWGKKMNQQIVKYDQKYLLSKVNMVVLTYLKCVCFSFY